MPGTLHFICGKAGSGKTTLGLELARTLPAIFFCEDAWLQKLITTPITTVADYVAASRRVRSVMAPLASDLLRLGVSVVLDFAGNTRKDRKWVRELADSADAPHLLHVIEMSDEACKARIRQRNETKPPGVYFGDVSEELFDAVTKYFVLPSEDEGLTIAPAP